ncbi:MAG: hypothetical protein PHR06_00435 [Candidatus Cloacimonetes bacterium]|nr:hypothetical protein [Candidatus Cloacimonadota bacterium]
MNGRVEEFLENNNMDYLYLVLSNLEINRLNSLPDFVKEKFDDKLTEVALTHVAQNEIPDYITEEIAEEENE